MKKLMALSLSALMMLSLVACGDDHGDDHVEESTDGVSETAVVAVGQGFGGDVEVAVEFDGTDIVSVTVLSHAETAGISDPALETLPSAIVEANGTDVDVVAGATFTSNAIIEAVNTAIANN